MRRKSSTFFKDSIFFGFILMISLFPFTSTCTGAEGLNRDFVAGMPKNFPPHFFIDKESGNPTGFGVDVMDAVANRCGINIKYEVFENWKKTNQSAKDGLIDIIPNMGFTSERQAFMDFTSPYETFRINYYIRATSSSIQSVADIENSKVGVVVTNKARFILEKKGQYNLVKVDSFEDLAWQLIAGDVDCIAMPEPVMDYLMQKSGLTDLILTLGAPLVEIKRGIGVTKGRKELFQLLQSTMDDFILSQDFKNIYTKWYGKPEPYWTPKRIGIVSAILFCSTIFAMAFWRYRFITKINKELEITVHDRTKKIEESEKRYKQMFLDNQAIKLVIDPIVGRIVEANDAACNFYQYPKDKLLSMKISDINTLSPEKIQEEMDAAKAQNRSQFNFPHKLANGEIRDVEVYSGPINVGDKTLLFSIIHDISERKKVEVAIQKSEQKYRHLIQTASDAIYLFSEDGRFSDVNPAACSMLNRSRDEILNLDIGAIDPNFSIEAFFDFWKETPLSEPRVFETTHLHKDDSLVPVEVSGQKFQVGEDVFFFGIARNISDRKHAEAALKESEERLKLTLESVSDAVWDWRVETGEVYFSSRWYTMLGYEPYELPQEFETWRSLLHPDDLPGSESKVLQHLESAEPFEIEFRMRTKDNQWRWILARGKNVETNEKGKAVRMLGTHMDITERKALEERIQQTQKMESIGTLAGGIAHDFNNILFPIVGHTEMLLEDVPSDSPFRKGLNQIYTGAMRARDLVQQILTFSRQESSELKLMKLQPIIKEALKLIRSTIPTTIEIKQDIQPDCGAIKADPTQIHQIIMNLTTNAFHAMEEVGGEMRVSLKEVELHESDISGLDIKSGKYACLSVADTGVGISEDVKEKIFIPFFTTKEQGKGTGMGLSVVHGIVKHGGGSIQVFSEAGKGTEFKVYFPIAESYSEIQDNRQNAVIKGGFEKILLVDDEESIIKMEKQMLERLGYQVTSHGSSLEALEAFRVNPDRFDLVITDFAMPNIAGDKLSIELSKIRPDIPILLCTGFSENMSEEKALSLGINGFLMKPVVMSDLSKKIRDVLDKV